MGDHGTGDGLAAILRVQHVRKSYGSKVALDDVSLEAAEGEIVSVLGRNGAGKTTLTSCIAGLLAPDEGRVAIAGLDPRAAKPRVSRLLGYAPQTLGVYHELTARENLELFGRLRGLRGKDLKREVIRVIELLGLTEFADRKLEHASGGEQRRTHTGAALIGRPRLLLLDEPTVGVDVSTRADLLAMIRAIAKEGHTVLYTTHYLAEVETLDARIAILHCGRIVARGSVEDLITRSADVGAELEFSGVPRSLANDPRLRVIAGDSVLRIEGTDAVSEAGLLLSKLGTDGAMLVSLKVLRPSIEEVFLDLTGSRPSGEFDERTDAA